MNELIWELFEMVREALPPTAQNVERAASWAKKYNELNPDAVAERAKAKDEAAANAERAGSPLQEHH